MQEVNKAICKLPNLHQLSMVIGSDTLLPSLVLPNLTALEVIYGHGSDWLQVFCGATLGKLTSVTILTDQCCASH